MPITMLFIIAFMVVMFSLASGNVDNALMKVCSYVPFTSSNTAFTTIFTSIKAPECITARIQKQRPVREKGVYSYGCQFVNLPPKLEMLIRNFVFRTPLWYDAENRFHFKGSLEGINI